jgi:hypothetical protein
MQFKSAFPMVTDTMLMSPMQMGMFNYAEWKAR